MKLPGDSDKQDKGVSHEMMQRSLQSQRRVVKRVGVLEDRVEAIDLKLATPTETPLALPPSPRQLALPPSKEEPPEPTPVESDEDWEGDPMDHRDLPWAQRGIDDLRDQIDKDPNIPFGDDKIPYEDDITQIMKDRDKSIEEDEKEEAIQPEVLLDGDPKGNNAKPLPTADGKKQRRKTKGKGKIGLPDIAPKKGGGMIGGLKQIAKNVK